jgi:uncharacterized membrane protein
MNRLPSLSSRNGPPGRKRQRGVASVIAMFWLLVAIAALGAIDIGNMFYQRRVLQSIADLAASAGAQVIDDACSRAPTTALGSAGANGLNPSATGDTISTKCGRWDPSLYAGPKYFTIAATPSNAVQVTVTRQVPYFFMGPARPVSAIGVAQAVNVGAFSIGTTTASVDPTVITSLLNGLLGTNLNPNAVQLTAIGYQGLAQSRIEIGDLMAAANVGTVSQLLALKVNAGTLAGFMLTALQTTKVLNANLTAAVGALQAIVNANIPGSPSFAIGAVNGAAGLLQVGLADTQSALHATISPFDALMVSAEIAQAGKSAINVATGLNLPGLGAASLKVQVIQPPVLVVGEAGKTPAGAWRTVATSSQVRAYLVLSLGGVPGNWGALPSAPLLQLPISIEVAPGQAWLVSTQCATTAAKSNTVVGVQPGIASVCVGDAPTDMSASTAFSCSQPATLVSIPNILTPGTPLLTIKTAGIYAPFVVPADASSTLTFDGIVGNSDDYQTVNSNRAGHVISYALSSLSASLSKGGLVVNTPVVILNVLINLLLPNLLSATLSTLLGLLTPILNSLDSILVPVLQLLGVQIGVSTIHGLPPVCGQSQLQY